jgi:hypothetical protein
MEGSKVERGSLKLKESWAKWCTPVILVLKRLKEEDCERKASLGYIGRPCLGKKKKRRNGLGV